MRYMTEDEYKKRLNQLYKDNVTMVSRYLNLRATSLFVCRKCGVTFYNRTGAMIASFEGRHHWCGERYASTETNSRKEFGGKRQKKYKTKKG